MYIYINLVSRQKSNSVQKGVIKYTFLKQCNCSHNPFIKMFCYCPTLHFWVQHNCLFTLDGGKCQLFCDCANYTVIVFQVGALERGWGTAREAGFQLAVPHRSSIAPPWSPTFSVWSDYAKRPTCDWTLRMLVTFPSTYMLTILRWVGIL